MPSWSLMSNTQNFFVNSRKPASFALVLHAPQRLREVRLPAPDDDVQGAFRRAGVDPLDQEPRAFRVVPFADVLSAALWIAGLDPLSQRVGLRPATGVLPKVRQHAFVTADDLADQVRPGDGLLQLARRA